MNSEPKTRDLVVTRVFAAPVERAWKAWSDSEPVMQWWGRRALLAPLPRWIFAEPEPRWFACALQKSLAGRTCTTRGRTRRLLLLPNGHARILDVGCGAGVYSIAFAKSGYDVTGVDVTQGCSPERERRLLQP